MNKNAGLAELIFFLTLAVTFGAALFARWGMMPKTGDEDLAGRGLNRWLIGLSAGTTGNSGFIVTGAVGLGYAGGLHWLLLPISWLLGDLIFWRFFPERLNRIAREANATTLSEILTFTLSGRSAKAISVTVCLLLTVFLSMYTSAQWLAGKKFLSGIFLITDFSALVFFAMTIVVYSSIGGFRGSVYTDVLQAFIRIIGTFVALGAVAWFALGDVVTFNQNISAAGDDFLTLFPNGGLVSLAGFILGYAGAAIGFGLGQPQIVSRYFAGSSPEETKAAMWIYIGFIQFTWIAMTSFGVVLRGVMPGIVDPETGLSLFFKNNIGAVASGIIFADVYATIASTSNGILVAISQTVLRDLIYINAPKKFNKVIMTSTTLVLGVGTIIISLVLPGNVFTIALDAVSKIGAGLAGPMIIKVFGWRHSGPSLLISMLAGISAAFIWKYLGYDGIFNEAGVGILLSLCANAIAIYFSKKMPAIGLR